MVAWVEHKKQIITHTHTHAHTRTHMHTHILTQARAPWGCPPFKPLVGGGALLLSHIFQGGGGLENYLGGGGVVWEGVLFFASQVVFCWSLLMLMRKCNFEIAGMPCNAVQCCGVLLSRKV